MNVTAYKGNRQNSLLHLFTAFDSKQLRNETLCGKQMATENMELVPEHEPYHSFYVPYGYCERCHTLYRNKENQELDCYDGD